MLGFHGAQELGRRVSPIELGKGIKSFEGFKLTKFFNYDHISN